MLFGDSHLAAVRRGLGQIDPARIQGIDLHFWGTPGHRFRHIDWQDGRILPADEATANAFARFGGEGLRELDPGRYDAVVFVGARIRPGAVIPDLLNHIADPDRYLTRAYVKAVLAAQFRGLSTYRMAQAMAAAGQTRVYLNPISLTTLRSGHRPRAYAMARRASRADLGLVWSIMAEVMAEDGIGAVLQPLDSVVSGYLTAERYGLPPGDDVHKNADYGALILNAILDAVTAPAPGAATVSN
jgi:hypothetical protein